MQTFDRMDRVGDQIMRILGELLEREIRDPRIGFVTLTGVEVSRDLSSARVFFTAGDGADTEEITKGLGAATGFMRSRLSAELSLRQTPELRFVYDDSVDRGFRMERILRGIAEERDDAS